MKVPPIGFALALPSNSKTQLERFSKGKPSSSLGLVVSDEGEKFYKIDTWCSTTVSTTRLASSSRTRDSVRVSIKVTSSSTGLEDSDSASTGSATLAGSIRSVISSSSTGSLSSFTAKCSTFVGVEFSDFGCSAVRETSLSSMILTPGMNREFLGLFDLDLSRPFSASLEVDDLSRRNFDNDLLFKSNGSDLESML